MFGRNVLLFIIALGTMAGCAGCGIGSLPPLTQQQPTPVSVIFVSAPPTSLAINASATIYAATTFSSVSSANNTLVNYSLSCASPNACGTLSQSDELGAMVYKAPPAIPASSTVTITATSVADSSLSRSATITITPPIPIAVSLAAGTPASVEINATVSLQAKVTNDTSANPQVEWTVTCGDSECGTFSPTTTANGLETAYTAPSAIPPGNTVTVTATSVTDPTKSVSTSITITAAAPTLANGTYVYQLSGPAGPNASFVTGVLVAQGGAIVGGEQDSVAFAIDDNGNPYPYAYWSGEIGGGSYVATPDGNLQITIDAGGAVETLNGVLASGGKGFVAQLYGSMGSGTLDLQTSTAAPSGGYAFSVYGSDLYGDLSYAGGILNVDSAGGISGAGSVFDVTGSVSDGSLAPSTVSAPDKFGRVQFVLNPAGSSSLPVQDLIGYIVDSTHIRLISTPANNSGNYQGVMGGLALGQGTGTGTFSSSSMAGTSYVFGASSQSGYGTNYQIAGVVTANAGGALGGTLNWNWLTNSGGQNPLPVNGTWTIDPTGRATLSNLTNSSTTLGSLTNSMYMYLTRDGNALLISSVYANPLAGQAFQQQAGAFTSASFSGSYGLNAGQADLAVVGSVTAAAGENGADNLAGFADSGNGNQNFAITGSVTPDSTAGSSGVFTGTLAGFDSASRATANDFTFYLVDNTRAVAIETDSSQLTMGFLQLQQ